MRERGVAASGTAGGRLWAGGRKALDLVEDGEGDEFGGGERLLVGEAEDPDAGCGEGGVTLGVVSKARLVPVLGAVDLDGELETGAEEVEGVGARGRLPPELGAEVAVAEDEPDASFGGAEIFGWAKTVACFRKTRFRGKARTQLTAHLVAAAYNLLRIAKLQAA